MLVFIFFLQLFLLLISTLLIQESHSATILVDGVSEWSHPSAQIGDSVVFEHKYHYDLYIFQNQKAFNSCNFTQATLLTRQNSTSYVWHPSRLGIFYFSFKNGTNTSPCLEGSKLAVKVSVTAPPPEASSPSPMSAPPISSGGGVVSSSPAYPWPFRPRQAAASPSPSPVAMLPATSPMVPERGGSIPFINSNPAVPLPTGEVDSTTIHPIPTSSANHATQMMVTIAFQGVVLCCANFLMFLILWL